MPLTNDQYVGRRGLVCPVCNSTDVTATEVYVEAGEATQDASCGDCLAEWKDNYHLVGYTLVSDGVER